VERYRIEWHSLDDGGEWIVSDTDSGEELHGFPVTREQMRVANWLETTNKPALAYVHRLEAALMGGGAQVAPPVIVGDTPSGVPQPVPPDLPTAGSELEFRAAAEALGISTEALRKRISRGSIPARKVAGVWRVLVGADADDVRPESPRADSSELARMQERIASLEAQLAQTQLDRDRWCEEATVARAAADMARGLYFDLLKRHQEVHRELGRLDPQICYAPVASFDRLSLG
jgi:hypothetical protein